MSVFRNSVLKQYHKFGCIPKPIMHHEKWEVKFVELFLSSDMQQKTAYIKHYGDKIYLAKRG